MSNIAAADRSRPLTNVGSRNLENAARDSKKCLRITSYVVSLILYTVGTLVIARLGQLNSISQSFGAAMVGGALLVLIICLSACQQSTRKGEIDENGEVQIAQVQKNPSGCQQSAPKGEIDENGDRQRAQVLKNPNVRTARGEFSKTEARRFIDAVRRKSEGNIVRIDARLAKLGQSASARHMTAATPVEGEILKRGETQSSQAQILPDQNSTGSNDTVLFDVDLG